MSVTERILQCGKIVYDVRVQYAGYRVSRTVPTTKTEAKRVESRILQDLLRGKFDIVQKTENPRFRSYAESYKESVTWHKSYRRTVVSVNHLIAYFGDKKLTEITTQDCIDYRSKRLSEGIAPATINREHACLQRMLKLAVESDEFLINKNPFRAVKLLKEKPSEDRIITKDEYYRLLDAAPEYFRHIILFACNTAMRLMEILDLQFGQIRIWFSGAEIELIDTKSGDKEFVPLNADALGLVRKIAQIRGIDLDSLSETDKQHYIFTGLRGQHIRSVRKPMLRTFREAGVTYQPFHAFRHFWTSEMFSAGVDPGTIQKAGRWKDFKTMMRYCHRGKAQTMEAVEKLSLHLNQTPATIVEMQKSGNL